MSRTDIYTHLLSKAINTHYIKRYYNFINSCKHKDNGKNEYIEVHHILPRGEFPEFSNLKEYSWNSVKLTLRQHFIAHMMLWKGIGKSQTFAFYAMLNVHNMKVTSRIYDSIKKDAFLAIGLANSKLTYYLPGTCDFVKLGKNEIPPEGYVSGSPYRKIQIYNITTHEQRIIIHPKFSEVYEIPNGWVIGNISSSKSRMGSTVWYDPITLNTKRIKKDELPPSGWVRGSPNTKSKKGKIAYYHKDTHEIKYFLPSHEMPDCWTLGIPEDKKANKGMAVYKDADGNTFRLEKDSPLIKENNLKGANNFNTIVKCPFCEVSGIGGGMRKSHFKNCKRNPNSSRFDNNV